MDEVIAVTEDPEVVLVEVDTIVVVVNQIEVVWSL